MLKYLLLLTILGPVFGWELLFRQTYGGGYLGYSDWYRNTHNPGAQIFSKLGDLEQFRSSDGSFHLYLYYPELGRGNEWRQTSNPVTAHGGGVTGYQPINISFDQNSWGGLELNNENCLLDGTVGDWQFWFAVGTFSDFNGGIPGGNNNVVHEVELYVQPDISSQIRFGQIFQSGMVLQANKANMVFGISTLPGEHFTVELFEDNELIFVTSSLTEKDLTWQVSLPSQEPGTGFRLVVTAQNIIAIEDLAFGEVWVCSGQSNMDFWMSGILDSEAEMANSAGYEDVRFVKLNPMTASEEMSDVWGGFSLPWSKPTDQNSLSSFSAVCFLYGRSLYDELHVPIGLIQSAWGGTPVESWCSEEALATCRVPEADFGGNVQNENARLWHAMIAPLTRLTIRGAVWYQGESNVGYNTDLYTCTFSQMIHTWRSTWATNTQGETPADFPFGFVQLGANAEQVSDSNPDSKWSLIRWHQTADQGSVPNSNLPNTFMATAVDTHDPDSPYGAIHPRDKLTVASRLAWACLKEVYSVLEYPSKGPQPSLSLAGEGVYLLEYDQAVVLNTVAGWEVCTAPDTQLCNTYLGWQDISVTVSTNNSFLLDTREVCNQGCSALAYLWRQTPCTARLQCPAYSADAFRLPVTPWLFTLK